MDTATKYRYLIRSILTEYTQVPYAYGDLRLETVFDTGSDRYLVVVLGRENGRRVHSCLIHVELIEGKIFIQQDGTEQGVATELVQAGVPKDCIVLGFRSPELRKHTEFAVA
jgi:hypothetical protein